MHLVFGHVVQTTGHVDVFAPGEEVVDCCALPCQTDVGTQMARMSDDIVTEDGGAA